MINESKLKYFSPQNLIDLYLGCYIEEFGTIKGAEIIGKINASNKVQNFISKLRAERFNPGEAGFISIVNSIPYFFFSKGETLGYASLLAIQKWLEVSSSDVFQLSQNTIHDITIKTIIRAQKTKVNFKFFNKYYSALEAVYELTYDNSSETLDAVFYTDCDNVIDYIRFYTDRTIITVSAGESILDSDKVLKWFNKENQSLSRGRYTLHDSKINFSTIESLDDGVVKYSGEFISEREIKFYIKSYINGNESNITYKKLSPPLFKLKSAMYSRI